VDEERSGQSVWLAGGLERGGEASARVEWRESARLVVEARWRRAATR
jgi:hypothetical protein